VPPQRLKALESPIKPKSTKHINTAETVLSRDKRFKELDAILKNITKKTI
jgi:hypothetical protein